MNCETCQELIHDLVDGSISREDEFTLNTHLERVFGLRQRAPGSGVDRRFLPHSTRPVRRAAKRTAMWLRIRNVIEAELPRHGTANSEPERHFRPLDGT